VSTEDRGTFMALIDIQRDAFGFDNLSEAFACTQVVLMMVAQYSQSIREVHMVCEHPQQIINLEWQITDLQTKQLLPPWCDHSELERQLQILTNKRDEARRRHAAAGTDEELRQELAAMIQDAQESGEEARSLRTQLANALRSAARSAHAAPQAAEDMVRSFPTPWTFQGRFVLS